MLAVLFRAVRQAPMSIETIASVAQVSYPLAHREVGRLLDSGLVMESRVGNTRLISAETSNPAVAALTVLMERSFGIPHLLTQALAGTPGLEAAAIYGSLAKRLHDIDGHAPRDVDLLIVGDVDYGDVSTRIRDVEQKSRLEVNPKYVSSEKWSTNATPFITRVKESPLVWVAGHAE